VLKTGAGYVPIAVDDPAERVHHVLRDSGAALIITNSASRRFADAGYLIRLGAPAVEAALGACPSAPLDDGERTGPGPEDVAYVIYTSGTTGLPKGTVVEHRALSSYLNYARSHYRSLAGRALLHSSISFDMAVTSLFGPLVSGGTVVIVDLRAIASGGQVPGGFERPSFLKITPSHLPLLRLLPPICAPAEELVIGGEQLLGAVLSEWRRDNPSVTVVNEYGPTEATVGCCTYFIWPGDVTQPGPVPIGTPTDDTNLYVLDEECRPVPDGQTGELYIAGGQLALGYLRQPSLTAERFVRNPFKGGGPRLYRTGDIARMRPDGNLEFLGRIDDQVKINGYRIELGEVEAVISRSEQVAHCAVAARPADSGHTQLVAYVKAVAGTPLDVNHLRHQVAEVLPAHMIPAAFVPVTDLPLTASGKLDRAALPEPGRSDHGDFTAPRTPGETLLCQLFADIIGVDRVGIDSDFIECGGSSIGAARLVTRARRVGLEIGLMDVLRKRTVRQILAS
jgi:amino acid adenylation domain-containing protein